MPRQLNPQEIELNNRPLSELSVGRFWGSFGPFFDSKVWGNIRKLILPQTFESKKGQNNPQKSTTFGFRKRSNNTPTQKQNHLLIGISLSLLAWLVLTVMNALTRDVHQQTTIPMILLFQNLVGLACTLPYVIKHHFKNGAYKHAPFFLIAIRCVSGQMNLLFLLLGVINISLANAVLLNNTAPFFIPLISWIWLRSKMDHKIWFGIGTGFIGLLLILRPTAGILSFGALYAIIAGISLAILMISMRLLSFKEKIITVSFYNFLLGALITIPLSYFYWSLDSWVVLFKLLLVGVLVLIGQLLLLRSFYYGKPAQLGPIAYIQVVYAALIDWIIWQQVPTLWTTIGMGLVCLSGILVTVLINEKPAEFPKNKNPS